jgi:pyridoxamine 5'-phosphate oxidase
MTALDALRAQIFARLAQLPCTAVLATVSASGAEARVMMLRQFNATDGTLRLYTDAATPKLREISAQPGASLLIYDSAVGHQIRLRVSLTVTLGDSDIFDRLPAEAQQNYGTLPPPGTPIAAATAYHRMPQVHRFAQIDAKIEEIDFVDISIDPHRRACFLRRGQDWQGTWLAP